MEAGVHLKSPYAMVERRVVGPKCDMFLLYLLSLFKARPMDMSSPGHVTTQDMKVFCHLYD